MKNEMMRAALLKSGIATNDDVKRIHDEDLRSTVEESKKEFERIRKLEEERKNRILIAEMITADSSEWRCLQDIPLLIVRRDRFSPVLEFLVGSPYNDKKIKLFIDRALDYYKVDIKIRKILDSVYYNTGLIKDIEDIKCFINDVVSAIPDERTYFVWNDPYVISKYSDIVVYIVVAICAMKIIPSDGFFKLKNSMDRKEWSKISEVKKFKFIKERIDCYKYITDNLYSRKFDRLLENKKIDFVALAQGSRG